MLLATDGTIRGGLFVSVDEKPFANEKTVEELWMAVTWYAPSPVVRGEAQGLGVLAEVAGRARDRHGDSADRCSTEALGTPILRCAVWVLIRELFF